jgi:hypothetical protein
MPPIFAQNKKIKTKIMPFIFAQNKKIKTKIMPPIFAQNNFKKKSCCGNLLQQQTTKITFQNVAVLYPVC